MMACFHNRKRISVIGLIGILIIQVVASGVIAFAREKTVELTWWHWHPDFQELYKTIVADFEAKNPDIKVKLVLVAGDYASKLMTAFASGTAPDLFALHSASIATYSENGLFLDIDKYIQKDKDFDISALIGPVADSLVYKGRRTGLPYATYIDVMFYNIDHFDDAALPPPEKTWNWDTFARTASKLTKDKNGDGTPDQWGYVVDFFWGRVTPWLYQAGANYFSDDYSKCLLDSPEAVEALEFLHKLKFAYKVGGGNFFNRTASMYITGPWDLIPAMKAEINFDVTLLPRYRRPASRVSCQPIHISSTTRHPDEAWKFAKFLVSREVQEKMIKTMTSTVPVLKEVAYDEYLKSKHPPKNKLAFIEMGMLSEGCKLPMHPRWPEIEPVINSAFGSISNNSKPVRTALVEAARAINGIIQKGKN